MSDSLGISDAISQGNLMNSRVNDINRGISSINSLSRSNMSRLKQNSHVLLDADKGQLSQEKDVDRTAEGIHTTELLSGANDLFNSAHKFSSKIEKPTDISTNIVPDGDKVIPAYSVKEPMPTGSLSDSYAENIKIPAETISKGAPPVEEASESVVVSSSFDEDKVAGGVGDLGKLSVGMKGLAVLGGGIDLVKDISEKSGTFGKLGTSEKVNNVSTIATGMAAGLEGAGAGPDATGVGAAIGIPLGIVGAVAEGIGLTAGAVSLGSGIYSDVKEELQGSSKVQQQANTHTPAPTLINHVAQRSQFGTGSIANATRGYTQSGTGSF